MSNDTALLILFIVVFLILLARPRKRSRAIPEKSKRLAWAKFYNEFYSDLANANKPLRKRDYEFDHIVPFSRGGSHDPDNIRVIPRKENRRKGAKMP